MLTTLSRLACAFIFALMVASCDIVGDRPLGDGPGQTTANTKNGIYTGSNIYFYGRFCGPDWPKVEEPDPVKAAYILSKIQPVDELDAVCKKHDICYETHHYFLQQCDNDFFNGMKRKFKTINCNNYAILLSRAIFSKFSYNPVPPNPGQLTLFGWKELQMHGNPLATLPAFGFDSTEFKLSGSSKPIPGEC